MAVILKHPVRKMTYKNRAYFGEIKVENERNVPNGAGLYRLDNYSFIMCEKVYKDKLNGMAILGSGNSGKLTYYEEGFAYGPCIEFNDENDILFSKINEYGNKVDFTITIKKDGTYYISQYARYGGVFKNKVLSFKKGLFCLEYRLSEVRERTAVVEKKVGWNFKYPFVRMYLMPYKDKSVAPAKIIQVGGNYIYRGGAQTPTFITNNLINSKRKDDYNYYDYVMARKKEFYEDDNSGRAHNVFYECRLDGYAIDYIDDESLYFGEVDDDKLGGIGCRKYKDYDYLGYLDHYGQDPERTGMKVYKNGVVEFGSFVNGDNVRFEIYNDFLFIKSYDKKQFRGNYYKLYFDTFDLEEYSVNNELLERITYPEVSEEMKKDDGKKVVIKTELTGEDLLDNQMRAELNLYEYTIPSVNEVEVSRFKRKTMNSDFHVFDIITKIKSGTFSGDDSIKIMHLPRNLKTLEEGSLNGMKEMWYLKFHGNSQISEIPTNVCDCPKLREIGFSKGVKRIASGAFSKCKSLTYVSIYEGCEIEKGAFPRRCKVNILSDNKTASKNTDKKANKEKVKSGKIIREKKSSISKHSKPLKRLLHTIIRPFKLLIETFESLFSLLAKPFRCLGKCASLSSLQTNVFSIISIIVMIATVLMNFFKINVAVNEWATDNIDVITGLFGLHLASLTTDLVSQSVLLNILLIVVIVLAFLIDCIVNILVVALLILYIVLFFVIGFAYSLAIPICMFILAIVGLVQKKSIANIVILILDICLIALFYVAIYI